jgi:anti-anti-sigma factor
VCRRLPQGEPADVVVDLRDVTFFDSSALSVLASLHGQVAARGSSVLLHGASPAIRRVLAVTRMEDHFTVVRSVEQPAHERSVGS